MREQSFGTGGAVNLEQRQGLINILLVEGTGDVKGFQVVLEFTHYSVQIEKLI